MIRRLIRDYLSWLVIGSVLLVLGFAVGEGLIGNSLTLCGAVILFVGSVNAVLQRAREQKALQKSIDDEN
jgi:hypothetical protein